jgi:hypothetical protein
MLLHEHSDLIFDPAEHEPVVDCGDCGVYIPESFAEMRGRVWLCIGCADDQDALEATLDPAGGDEEVSDAAE